jgi:Tfp pilus assembly protein PilF
VTQISPETGKLVASPPNERPRDSEAHLPLAVEHSRGAAGAPKDDLRPRSADFTAFLDLAIERLAQGDAQTALAAASEACHRAPKQPRAHYAYGQAWLALNQPQRAEQAFAAALQLAPTWADAWINYGLALYRQGQLENA